MISYYIVLLESSLCHKLISLKITAPATKKLRRQTEMKSTILTVTTATWDRAVLVEQMSDKCSLPVQTDLATEAETEKSC